MKQIFVVGVQYIAPIFLASLLLAFSLPIAAQETTPEAQPTRVVTTDDVNEVADGMFCPICENEPLDTCQANTCITWRGEIRAMLEQGMTEAQIVDNFIDRFGQRVVDVPEESGLRLLTFIGPVAVGTLALIVGMVTFLRWRGNTQPTTTNLTPPGEDNDYRSRLEADLQD